MSWNTFTPDAQPKASIDVPAPTLNEEVKAEQREQFAAALAAAKELARVVGRPEDDVHISLTGHANPGHGPRSGWAEEMVSVTVSARPRT